ncbi:Hypothetical Protein RradSPS_2231 [Rubrobacter radiotolerans]|uniref:Uncharacterized protein n=1 Tax=Rubrobacter radiotolerans TaxID=42256 RepID=A0A023X641_RUBRA|nr:hypothetical protein [Rubrobacter radiotolerans]AHY47514.1 Hypothetical Protein RradSPS_2231 [Rubrobacter radiotolerans]MDX5894917.1 hypothetical protein [Rubrobacter radiotolerans]SMC07063.1 hypothetical protein SAMN00767673_2233 [Rubrobacter radiotolerans DSM 5868]
MSEQFSIERHGHRIEVESDESLILISRVRLFVDGRLTDERVALWEVRLHGELSTGGEGSVPVKVEVSYGLLGGVEKCVLIEDGIGYPMSRERETYRSARPELASPKPDGETELLRAIKEAGGRITPLKAAAETSLTVREADAMLSELVSDGHLFVESEDGSLVYSLPGHESEQ